MGLKVCGLEGGFQCIEQRFWGDAEFIESECGIVESNMWCKLCIRMRESALLPQLGACHKNKSVMRVSGHGTDGLSTTCSWGGRVFTTLHGARACFLKAYASRRQTSRENP